MNVQSAFTPRMQTSPVLPPFLYLILCELIHLSRDSVFECSQRGMAVTDQIEGRMFRFQNLAVGHRLSVTAFYGFKLGSEVLVRLDNILFMF